MATTAEDHARMSHTDGMLDHPNHYDFQPDRKSEYKRDAISADKFFQWTRDNMYKSSYNTSYCKGQVEPKNVAIPKYKGYIPYVHPENIHAKGYSSITREAFGKEKLGKNPFQLSSTGYNLNTQAFVDPSQNASTSKYGKSALQMPHPAWQVSPLITQLDHLISTTHDTFRNPNSRLNPTFRETDTHLQTQKLQTKHSGFGQNHSYLDGKGWIPH